MTLFCAAVGRARCGVHKLLRTGEVPTTLTFIVLVVADGLLGLLGRVILRYFTPPTPPLTPVPPSQIDLPWSLWTLSFIAVSATPHYILLPVTDGTTVGAVDRRRSVASASLPRGQVTMVFGQQLETLVRKLLKLASACSVTSKT